METIKTAVAAYQRADEILRLSAGTRRRVRLVLDLVITVAGSSTPVSRITRATVDEALAVCVARGAGARTINSYKSVLRGFGAWAFDLGLIKKNPCAHLKNARAVTARNKRQPATADQARTIINNAWSEHPCLGLSVMILLYTGIRASELIGLTWGDVDFDRNEIQVLRSKVNDYLVVPIPTELRVELLAWAIHPLWEGRKCSDSDHVVPALVRGLAAGPIGTRMNPNWPLSNPTRPQSPDSLRDKVKELLRDVGITDVRGKGPHTLRRTAANLIADETGDVRSAQMLLGHSSLTTTEIYLNRDSAAARYRSAITNFTIKGDN